MSPRDRIQHPDRRTDDLTPAIERRGGEERRIPEWRRRSLESTSHPFLAVHDVTTRSAA